MPNYHRLTFPLAAALAAVVVSVSSLPCSASDPPRAVELVLHQVKPGSLLGMTTDALQQEIRHTNGAWTMTADAAEFEMEGSFETHRIHLVLRDGRVFAVRETWQRGILPTRKTAWSVLDRKDHPELVEVLDSHKPVVLAYQDGFETTVYLNAVKTVRKKWQSMHPGVHVLITYRTSGPPQFMQKCGNTKLDQEALELVAHNFPKPLDYNVPVWGFTVELQ